MKDVYFVAVKVFLEDGRGNLLITKDRFGDWDIPGGRLRDNDFETPLEQIVERKMREELGDAIVYKLGEPVVYMRHEREEILESGDRDTRRIFAIGYKALYLSGDISLGNNHEKFEWVSVATFEPEKYFTGGWLKGVQEYLLKRKLDLRKKIYFATTNKAKIASLQRDLTDSSFEVLSCALDIPEIRSEETEEIAKNKVQFAFKEIGKPCVAQDGGFYIKSQNGFPKAYVHFALDTVGIDGILKLVDGKDRECEFRDSLAYMDETLQEPIVFTSVTRGALAEAPRGELQAHNWGPIHKIFIPMGEARTFTEMSAAEIDVVLLRNRENWCGPQLIHWLETR